MKPWLRRYLGFLRFMVLVIALCAVLVLVIGLFGAIVSHYTNSFVALAVFIGLLVFGFIPYVYHHAESGKPSKVFDLLEFIFCDLYDEKPSD